MEMIDRDYAKSLIDLWLKENTSRYSGYCDPMAENDEFRESFIGKLILYLWCCSLNKCNESIDEAPDRTLAEDVILGLWRSGVPKERFRHSGDVTYVRLDCLAYKIVKRSFQTYMAPLVRGIGTYIHVQDNVKLDKDQLVEFLIEFDSIALMAKEAAEDALFHIRIENMVKKIERINAETLK